MSSSATGKQVKSKGSQLVQDSQKTKPLTNQNKSIIETINLADNQPIDDQINKILSLQPCYYGITQNEQVKELDLKNNIWLLRNAQFTTDCPLIEFENNYNLIQRRISDDNIAKFSILSGASSVEIGNSSSYMSTVLQHISYVTEVINQIDTTSSDNLYFQYALAFLLAMNFFLRRFQKATLDDIDLIQDNIQNHITDVKDNLHKEITEVKNNINNRFDKVDSKLDQVEKSLLKEITEVKDSLNNRFNNLDNKIEKMMSQLKEATNTYESAFNFYIYDC